MKTDAVRRYEGARGLETDDMLRRYSPSGEPERALDLHRRCSPADKLLEENV